MKNRHLRARLPQEEYQPLKIAADRAGMTLSEYVRCVLVRDRQALEQEQFLAKIDARLSGVLRAPELKDLAGTELEPLLVETLLLIRELVSERNAQALSRVALQLNVLYPTRRKI
jgi:hypothetical protein